LISLNRDGAVLSADEVSINGTRALNYWDSVSTTVKIKLENLQWRAGNIRLCTTAPREEPVGKSMDELSHF
jgi:hypothetical protein